MRLAVDGHCMSGVVAMPMKPLNLLAALAVISVPFAEAAAGGKPAECYQRVYRAPLHDTVRERVQIQGAWIRLETNPAIYDTRPVRRLVSPEQVIWRVIPAQYDTVREKVYPARRIARTVPAVTRTVYRKQRVDGGYGWEYRRIHGKPVLCKVKRRASWRTVAETVVVSPARTVYDEGAAQYGYRERRVLVHEARKEAVVVPAQYTYELAQVQIQPEWVRPIEVPAIYRTVSREVQVRPGSASWERVPLRCR
jgi:hypothetical protein